MKQRLEILALIVAGSALGSAAVGREWILVAWIGGAMLLGYLGAECAGFFRGRRHRRELIQTLYERIDELERDLRRRDDGPPSE